MDKQEALIEFLKGLRIAINNSQAYSRQHPYFLKSAQEFKKKIEGLFIFLSPIKVNISPEALFLDDKYWDKVVFSKELAQSLHQRKIKSIEFSPGLDVNELADFLSFISLQPREIFKNGGLSNLLKNTRGRHISVEELDYSGFLGDQGEEAKDIWLHLFKEAVEKEDKQKIDEFADNFFNGVKNLSVKTVIDDDNLRKGLGGFLHYLKDNHKDKFTQCASEFSRLILSSASNISGDNVDKLKEVFKDFDGNDFADALLSQASDKKSMDALNIGLFSQLAGKERADKLASSLVDQVGSKAALKNNPALLKKINDLLSVADSTDISPTYRNALFSLVKNISFKDSLFIDWGQLQFDYRRIILNLLFLEKERKGLDLVLERLNKDWPVITQDKDYGFLRSLSDILRTKNKDGDLASEALEDIEKQIAEFVENNVWSRSLLHTDLIYLADNLKKSCTSADFYLNKIFREKKVTFYGLKLFLRFFPDGLENFYKRIEEMRFDLELLSRIIGVIAKINLRVSLTVLKEIFYFGNELIKVEVLKAMQVSPEVDTEFIFPLLEVKSVALRKEALRILLRNNITKQKSIDMLLGIPSPWGSKNYLILENLRIIEALDLKDARDYVIYFSKKRFFWNRELRKKALGVLEGWK